LTSGAAAGGIRVVNSARALHANERTGAGFRRPPAQLAPQQEAIESGQAGASEDPALTVHKRTWFTRWFSSVISLLPGGGPKTSLLPTSANQNSHPSK
jgi:hypothetical protein